MRKMVINTYLCLQIFLVVWGLIHLELALTGMLEGYSSSLWYLILIKSTIILGLAISTDTRAQLCTVLYSPQLGLDLLYLVSPHTPLGLVFILLAYLQLGGVIFGLTSTWPKRSKPQAEGLSID